MTSTLMTLSMTICESSVSMACFVAGYDCGSRHDHTEAQQCAARDGGQTVRSSRMGAGPTAVFPSNDSMDCGRCTLEHTQKE